MWNGVGVAATNIDCDIVDWQRKWREKKLEANERLWKICNSTDAEQKRRKKQHSQLHWFGSSVRRRMNDVLMLDNQYYLSACNSESALFFSFTRSLVHLPVLGILGKRFFCIWLRTPTNVARKFFQFILRLRPFTAMRYWWSQTQCVRSDEKRLRIKSSRHVCEWVVE